MKKLSIITATLITTASLFFAGAVKAAPVNPLGQPCSSGAGASATCQDNNAVQSNPGQNPIVGPNGIITDIVKILSYIIGVAAIVVIIISAIRMIVSGGDPNNVSSSRNAIIYSLIGLAIAVFAQVIVAFILNKV